MSGPPDYGIPNPWPQGLSAPQDWLDYLLPFFPNSNPDLIKFHLLDTLRDFCRRSQCWRDWSIPIKVDGTVNEYVIDPGWDQVEVATVRQVWEWIPSSTGGYRGSRKLNPVTPQRAGPLHRRPIGEPLFYWQYNPGVISFSPHPRPPSPPAYVVVYAALVPKDICVTPEWLHSEYSTDIVKGVQSKILSMPGVNYKPADAKDMRRQYEFARGRAYHRGEQGYNTATDPIPIPYFAGGSQR